MSEIRANLVDQLRSGSLVPYIGPGALQGVRDQAGKTMPATSDELILAINNGQPMAPRLMYEFPRAAMHLENKKGRSYIERELNGIYAGPSWQNFRLHTWLTELNLPYIIDTNRDSGLPLCYDNRPHTLVVGVARIAAHPLRFDICHFNGEHYKAIEQEQVDTSLPVLFKPLGCALPTPSYVASDADFVDYITELMGGFAVPTWLKTYRKNKQYLFLGMRFTRDTERMVMSDLIYAASDPAGYALIPNPTEKEKRYCDKKHIQIIEQDWTMLSDELELSVSEPA